MNDIDNLTPEEVYVVLEATIHKQIHTVLGIPIPDVDIKALFMTLERVYLSGRSDISYLGYMEYLRIKKINNLLNE